MKKLISITLCVAFSLGLNAATYYVDFSSGSDSNTGASGSPWKHCPGDTNATSTATSTVLAADDTVLFATGSTYFGTVNLSRSGTTNQPITFDGGASRASFNFSNSTIATIGFDATAAISNLVIRNFNFRDIGGYATLPDANGCTNSAASRAGKGINLFNFECSDVRIENCNFEEIGEWHPQDPVSDATIDGSGISLQNAKRVVIANCEFTKLSAGISIKANNFGTATISDIEVTNCNFHNYIRWCIDIAPRSAGTTNQDVRLQNILIHDSQFHDYAEYDSANWLGCGANPHTDGIFIRRDYDYVSWSGLKIYGNQFYNTTTTGGGTACIYITEGPSVDVFNNVFINTLHGRTVYLGEGPWNGYAQTVRIYNNTFYNNHTAVSLTGIARTLGFVAIKNNIFYDTRTGSGNNFAVVSEQTNQLPDELDYNLYYSQNTAGKLNNLVGLGELSLANLRTNGFETHGNQSDPLLVDISSGLSPDPLANNLHLSADSPAIGAAESLASYFTTDKSGSVRSSWDIGAYEFAEEEAAPAATIPTHLRMRVR